MKPFSIRHKLALAVATFFILFILGFLLMNELFLEKYYIHKIEGEMNNYANMIINSNDLSDDIPLSENIDALRLFRELSSTTSYRFEVVDKNIHVLMSSVPEFTENDRFEFPQNLAAYLQKQMAMIDETGSDYVVFQNPSGDQDVVMLATVLSGDQYLILTEQLEAIQTNVAIANQFFLIIGLALTSVWVVVTYLLSKTITDPIVHISSQAKDIAAFDFTSRYNGQMHDEIGQLGGYMNSISKELEGRIAELSRMNLQLKDDMTLQRRFLASISHEFKSPVGIINGYAESIKLNYYKSETEKNRFVDHILDSADQLSALVEDMIMLSMLDKREFKLSRKPTNLSELLDKACQKMEEQYKNSPVSLELEIQAGIHYACDQIRMIQVFDNLLVNGFRYTSEPWHFKVALFQYEDKIHLRFTNNCPPIDDQNLAQIFTPFFRFEKSHNKKTGGHGLGLSVVKALIEAHDGTIEATYAQKEFCLEIVFKA